MAPTASNFKTHPPFYRVFRTISGPDKVLHKSSFPLDLGQIKIYILNTVKNSFDQIRCSAPPKAGGYRMSVNRTLLGILLFVSAITACSCGIVGPAGAVIAGIAAAGGGGGGGGEAVPLAPFHVALGPASPAGSTIMYNAANTSIFQFALVNNHDFDVDVSSIALSANGTVNDAIDISFVKLYLDNDGDGQISVGDSQLAGNQTFSTDNGTATFTGFTRTIVQGTSELYIGIVDLSSAASADHNETLQLGIAQGLDINAVENGTANLVTTGGTPLYGSLFNIQGVAQLEVSEGTDSPSDGGVFEGASDVVMLQLKVTAGNAEGINLTSLTIAASGSLNDATDITSVELYHDVNNNGALDTAEIASYQIDTDTYSVNNGTIIFDLTGRNLSAGQSENWLVVYDLASSLTPNLTFQVRVTDMAGAGMITALSAIIVGTTLDGPVMHIQGIGTVTVASAVPPSASDVPFVGEWPVLHLSFTAGANEDVNITSITLAHIGTGSVAGTDVSAVNLYHDVNGNGRYDTYADSLLASAPYTGSNVTLNSFTLTCTASAVTHALVQHVMAGNAAMVAGVTYQLSTDPATNITATGSDTLQTITPGGASISGPAMTVQRDVWRSVLSSGLSARYLHGAVSMGTDFAFWGGYNGSSYYANGAIYHPLENNWTNISTTSAPAMRRQHCMVWTGKKIFVWGGYNGSYLGNGGMYDPADNSWSTISSTNAPTSRMDAVAVWTGSRVIVFGGYNGSYLDTGGIYDPDTDTWTLTDTVGAYAPDGRRYFAGDWNGTGIAIWGGFNGGYLDDGAILNPSSNSWSPIGAAGAPDGRRSHTVTWCADRLVVWGGYGQTDPYLGDGSSYYGGGWAVLGTTNAPTERGEHTAVWSGEYMLVWGGKDASVTLLTGSRLDPATGNWLTMNTTSAPTARRQHGAAWTAGGMVIWGGNTSASTNIPDSTGGRYLP